MPENKKYYYMRLKEDFFDSEEMVVLESMPDGVIYQNILLKMYCRSLKNDGRLMFNSVIPYSPTMLANITRHQVGTVEKALQIFQKLGLIEILDNGAIYMLDIQNYIGKSSTESDRIREYRARIDAEKETILPEICTDDVTNVQEMYDICTTEIEREKELKIETEREKEPKVANATPPKGGKRQANIDYSAVLNLFNETCKSLPKALKLSDSRKKKIQILFKDNTMEEFATVFSKAEQSDFLKGNVKVKDREPFKANLDWLLEQKNFIKTLEGNYDNRVPANDGIDHSLDFMFPE